MDNKVLDFWRKHSVNFLSMAFETGRHERIQHPDGYGKCSRECGDTLEIYLMSRSGRIGSASFYTEGCIYTIACANALVRMIEGKSIEQAWGITPRQIADFLESLPKAEMHCAELAVRTLHAALLDLRETERQPWIKFYRKPGNL
ncbi:MAG: iron-sulfur cluster assembly scaffold protein [Syntrophobacteraceae bacterium]|jgi:nitrogen fixation NifU-like protein